MKPDLYYSHLVSNGFVSTRANDLSCAISDLHRSICLLDTQQLKIAEKLLDKSVRDVINEFGDIEELRKGF